MSSRHRTRHLLLAAAMVVGVALAPSVPVGATPVDPPGEQEFEVSAVELLSVPETEIDDGSETIAGQYLVTFASDPARARSLPAIEAAGWAVLHDPFADVVGRGDTTIDGSTILAQQPWVLVEFAADVADGLATRIAELRGLRDVVRVSPNHVRRLVQTDPPWGLDRLDQRALPLSGSYLPDATGAGVRVYVVDDGIRREHVDFGGRVTAGAVLESLEGGDSHPTCSTHGSHVAGTVGGTYSGVAKQVELIPVRVFDCQGSALDPEVIAAMDWIKRDHLQRGGGTAVVNMSFGGRPSSTLDAKVAELDAAGLVVVAAAGNEGANACNVSPARAAASITVAASTPSDARAGFSNFGPCVDLFAPGEEIVSVRATGGFVESSGTSMAAPHAAGAAALIIQRQPGLSAAQVRERLISDATTGVVSNPGTGTPNRLLWVAPASIPTPTPTSAPTPAPEPDPTTGFVSANASRLVDSRVGLGVAGTLWAGQTVVVQVAGRADVPRDASAAVLNVTAVEARDPGFVSVTPCNAGSTVPSTSSLNFGPGDTVANAVITPLSGDGAICIYTSAPLHLLVDVVGAFEGGFDEVPPTRLLDTRGAGVAPAGSITTVRVGGRAGVDRHASAAVLNVTAVGPDAPGFLTVYPCGGAPPNASNVNYEPGVVVPNAVVSRLSPDGDVCVFTSATTHLLVDVAGALGDGFTALTPQRLLETRPGPPPIAESVTVVEIADRAGVPSDARAVVLNVTAVDPAGPGFVSVFPCGADWRSFQPDTSSLNYAAGRTVANAVVAPLGTAGGTRSGAVCLYTSAQTHLLVDVAGAFR